MPEEDSSSEIELLTPDQGVVVVEISMVDTRWQDQPARLISLRDVTEGRRMVSYNFV